MWLELRRLIERSQADRHIPIHTAVAAQDGTPTDRAKNFCNEIPFVRFKRVSGNLPFQSKIRGREHRASRMARSTTALAIFTVAMRDHHRCPVGFITNGAAKASASMSFRFLFAHYRIAYLPQNRSLIHSQWKRILCGYCRTTDSLLQRRPRQQTGGVECRQR